MSTEKDLCLSLLFDNNLYVTVYILINYKQNNKILKSDFNMPLFKT